ncbi:hypothetical protein BOX30_06400 [Leptospirillum ferriphilum]|uniref:Uncharacterized protein n=1 Tax=Leptospirillum ferriphilum TaxID=178606 RepID=A0A1V3SUF8_9BACT|nr:hypothetical protein BOX24_07645 [Leptospirillum ferriphilum]OOH79646.1 hypothetical protein BOX30_06400 [Leptospirillum ferriphilum]
MHYSFEDDFTRSVALLGRVIRVRKIRSPRIFILCKGDLVKRELLKREERRPEALERKKNYAILFGLP